MQQALPANILREIYRKADPRVQARMRMITKDVQELQAPKMPEKRLERELRAAFRRINVVRRASGSRGRYAISDPLSIAHKKASNLFQQLERGANSTRLAPDARAAIRDVDAAIRMMKTRYSLTNADMSRAAAKERSLAKKNALTPVIFDLEGGAAARRTEGRLERRAERREKYHRELAKAARTAMLNRPSPMLMRPGKGAPFDVLRGGKPRALPNLVRASALHPSVRRAW